MAEQRNHQVNVLSFRDRQWIEWILPADRSEYAEYRDLISGMVVIGEGRRGKGEMILGYEGREVDLSAPLPPVFAYGAIETNFGIISITLREVMDDQISVEIVCHRSEEVPEEFEEARRWTYSTWKPGAPCPQCGGTVREVSMHTATDTPTRYVLAICARDRRLWVFDEKNDVNRLIPPTNYYNELMLHKHIRDANAALDAKRLFTEISSFTDADLTHAFMTYNKLKSKVQIEGPVEADTAAKPGPIARIRRIFLKR